MCNGGTTDEQPKNNGNTTGVQPNHNGPARLCLQGSAVATRRSPAPTTDVARASLLSDRDRKCDDVTMQLEMGSTPAPGVASRRPRRVDGPRAESLSSEFVRAAAKVTGEGANHDARGGRAPLLQHSYG